MRPAGLVPLLLLVLSLAVSPALAQSLQRGLDAAEQDDYETALREWRPLAEQGDPQAQTYVGRLYEYGLGVSQDSIEAMQWYRQAADQGYAPAQKAVGDLYSGDPAYFLTERNRCSKEAMTALAPKMEQAVKDLLTEDPSKADDIMKKAQAIAAAGSAGKIAEACELSYRLAEELGVDGVDSVPDYIEAVRWYRLAADQNHAPAQTALGVLHSFGNGVPQSYEKAVTWFRSAASLEDPEANYRLGWSYEKGHGVPQDYAEAIRFYTLAAELGYAEARFRLGSMHFEGLGTPQDYLYAHMWFNLAAASGHREAEQDRDKVARKMTPADISQAQRMAREWVAAN